MTRHEDAQPARRVVFVGVDVGGRGVRLVTEASPGGRSGVVDAATPGNYQELVDLIGKLAAKAGQGIRPTSTVVGLPGTTSDDRPTWVPALPYLDRRPLAQDLREVLSGPVRLGNDAQLALYGEATEGAARGVRNVVLVTVGTGIGGAVLVEGRILRGAHGSAGSFGWLPAAGAHPTADHGAFELVASGGALDREARTVLGLPGARALVEAARRGDRAALEVAERYGERLGVGVAAVASLFDPELVLVCGGLSAALDLLGPVILQAVRANASPHGRSVTVKAGALGPRAGVIGALRAARRGGEAWL
jgi:predicted NBD/HSP70 family sugar kinase